MHCGRFWQCDSYHYLVHKGKSKSKRVNWARLREMGYAISSTATNKNYVDLCLQIISRLLRFQWMCTGLRQPSRMYTDARDTRLREWMYLAPVTSLVATYWY